MTSAEWIKASVRVTTEPTEPTVILVKAPYKPKFICGLLEMGGRCRTSDLMWRVPLEQRTQLRELLLAYYDTDGGLDEPLPTADEVARIIASWP